MAEVSLPHQHGFKDGTLAIPIGLARDSSQAYLRDRAGLATASNSRYCWIAGARCRSVMYWQRRAGETWPSRANSPWSVTSPGSNQLVQLMGQCQNSCNPMRTPLWLANGVGSEGGRRNTDTPQRYRLNVSSN